MEVSRILVFLVMFFFSFLIFSFFINSDFYFTFRIYREVIMLVFFFRFIFIYIRDFSLAVSVIIYN